MLEQKAVLQNFQQTGAVFRNLPITLRSVSDEESRLFSWFSVRLSISQNELLYLRPSARWPSPEDPEHPRQRRGHGNGPSGGERQRRLVWGQARQEPSQVGAQQSTSPCFDTFSPLMARDQGTEVHGPGSKAFKSLFLRPACSSSPIQLLYWFWPGLFCTSEASRKSSCSRFTFL